MNDERTSTHHPSDETLAAFADGRLTGTALQAMTEHLATCDDCLSVMEVLKPAETASAASMPPRRTRAPWLAAAAALLVIAGIGAVVAYTRSRENGIARLAAAAPSAYRTVEPRLTGFRWAELRRLRAEETSADPEALRLGGVAGEVLQRAREDDSAEAGHAAGVASLLVQQHEAAIETLRRAAESDEANAAVWSDLAAAYYTAAVQARRAGDLPLALAAADKAVALDANHAAARFNRALILGRMGLRDEAAAEWRAFLALEPSSPWADEARTHLSALGSPRSSFRGRLPEIEAAAARGDAATVERIVRAHPQEVRRWFETEFLGSNPGTLEPARLVGATLRAVNGDALLADAVAALDRDARLKNAHAIYRNGRLHYRDQKLADAEHDLAAAAHAFAGTPMANVAQLYLASVRFDSGRVDEAAALLDAVVRHAPPPHRSLLAETRLQRARCAIYGGRWSDAIRDLAVAAETFHTLGETPNRALTVTTLAAAYAGIGEREKAWEQRLDALRLFAEAGDARRLIAALAEAARTELRDERLASAEAMLRLEIEEARRGGSALLLADAFRRRALLRAHMRDEAAGAADLREARGFLGRIEESGLRASVENDCLLAEGVLARSRDSRRSVALLTAAVEAMRGEPFRLPEALLERARSHRAAGDRDAALDDLTAGLAEIERQRPAESAIFETAAPLFEETVALLVERGDAAGALGVAERVYARSLADRIAAPAATAEIVRAIPAGTAIVEYALIPDGVAAIVVTPHGLSATAIPVARGALRDAVRALRDAIDARRDVRAPAAALHALLIEPIRELASADALVIVADRMLQAIPWAALFDRARGAYLVERHELTVAPSATVWLRSRGRVAERGGARLLLVTGDDRPGLEVLDRVQAETDAVAALYPDRAVLPGAALAARANDCDVIHFAGHAREGTLLAGGELNAAEIARLSLRRPRLAVLAACSTLTGDESRIDGMPGLGRAFLAAGVPSVVGTLWPVDDAHAATLFTELHRRYRNGATPAAALRAAQLTMLRAGGPSAHPAAWAAAELLGG